MRYEVKFISKDNKTFIFSTETTNNIDAIENEYDQYKLPTVRETDE